MQQICTVATVEFDDTAVADFFDAQVDAGLRPEQFARVWIHTHHGDSASPSSTDEETFARVLGSSQWAMMFIGRRIDLTNDRMLHLGLRLEQRRQQAASNGLRGDAVSPKLPRLWAAFRDWNASWLQGERPEFAETQNRFDYEPQRLLENFRRKHFGLTLLPCDWVSPELDRAVMIFAELDGFPRRRAFRINQLPGSLVGYQGAVGADTCSSHNRTPTALRAVGGAIFLAIGN